MVAALALPMVLKFFVYSALCMGGMRWLRAGPAPVREAAFLAAVKLLVGGLGYIIVGLVGAEALDRTSQTAALGIALWLEWGFIEPFVLERRLTVLAFVAGSSAKARVWRVAAAAVGVAYDSAMLSILSPLGRV